MSLLEQASRSVVTISPSATLLEAAREMKAHSVGCLVLTNGANRGPVGIVTDRDIVCRLAAGDDPATSTLSEFARGRLEVAVVGEGLEAILRKMRLVGVRRLPVIDSYGHLSGLISLDDILGILGRELSAVGEAIDRGLQFERAQAERDLEIPLGVGSNAFSTR